MNKSMIGALVAASLTMVSGAQATEEAQTPIDIVKNLTRPETANVQVVYPNSCALTVNGNTNPSTTTVYGSGGTSTVETIAAEWGSYKVTVPSSCNAYVMVGPKKYNLVQFHFHTPSEHALDGKRYPVEVHFVHAKDGATLLSDVDNCGITAGERPLLVVGAFINPGKSGALDAVFTGTGAKTVNLAAMLPSLPQNYFHYDGSLTAPNTNCAWPEGGIVKQLVTGVFPESVNWYVLGDVKQLSGASVSKLQGFFPEGNSRALKGVNGRTVYRTGSR